MELGVHQGSSRVSRWCGDIRSHRIPVSPVSLCIERANLMPNRSQALEVFQDGLISLGNHHAHSLDALEAPGPYIAIADA
jgi:hypothetical protein